jgi:hypothetical protein
MTSQIRFGPDDEEGTRLIDSSQTGKVHVGTVHDVMCTGFECECAENTNIMNVGGGNSQQDRQLRLDVQERMDLDGCGGFLVDRTVCPREQAQAQIDNRGVEGVASTLEFTDEMVVTVEYASVPNEGESQIMVDLPRTMFVRIGQC